VRTGCVIEYKDAKTERVLGRAIFMVDSLAVAAHECTHVAAIDGEMEHPSEWMGNMAVSQLYLSVGTAPAPWEPCGPSAKHTGPEDYGRALVVEEWEHLMP
jgi:hypothetical protein